jgi:hypothetical protein
MPIFFQWSAISDSASASSVSSLACSTMMVAVPAVGQQADAELVALGEADLVEQPVGRLGS